MHSCKGRLADELCEDMWRLSVNGTQKLLEKACDQCAFSEPLIDFDRAAGVLSLWKVAQRLSSRQQDVLPRVPDVP